MDVVSAACISAVIRWCVCMCVSLCTSPPVWFSTATLAAAFGEACVCVCVCVCVFCVCVCVCSVCVRCASLEDQLGFQRLCV